MPKRLIAFNSVFTKLFASVMLALILFAIAMVLMTHLLQGTSSNTRHQILASQVTQQIEPMLLDLRTAQNQNQRLESRYLLALLRRSFNVYSESLNARFGLYDAQNRQPIMLMEGMPPMLPPEPSPFAQLFLPDDPHKPVQIQTSSQSGYVLLYESNLNNKPHLSPAFNLITGTLLLLLIMSGMLWFIARTMTWRINQLSRQITQFGEGNFSARVTPIGHDEISTLANGFNLAAQRIESLMNANKLLLAHASHEIRTPITRIRLQVEMMSMLAGQLPDASQEKFSKRADAINRDLTGLNNLVESILLVSRLDAGHAMEKMERVDMYELIKGEVQHYQQASFDGSHVFIDGQASLLTHLIRNLLDNAHLHGVPPVKVELYAIDTAGHRIIFPDEQVPQRSQDDTTLAHNNDRIENPAIENTSPNPDIKAQKLILEKAHTASQHLPIVGDAQTPALIKNDAIADKIETDIIEADIIKTPDVEKRAIDNEAENKFSGQNFKISKPPVEIAVEKTTAPPAEKPLEKPPLPSELIKSKEKLKLPTTLFTRRKTEKTVATAITPSYQRIRIAVIDQGEGIALDKREEIFSPFVRLKQEKKGSGLGLSLVSQIVSAHQGTIITDTLDGHTRFLITLPVSQKLF